MICYQCLYLLQLAWLCKQPSHLLIVDATLMFYTSPFMYLLVHLYFVLVEVKWRRRRAFHLHVCVWMREWDKERVVHSAGVCACVQALHKEEGILELLTWYQILSWAFEKKEWVCLCCKWVSKVAGATTTIISNRDKIWWRQRGWHTLLLSLYKPIFELCI